MVALFDLKKVSLLLIATLQCAFLVSARLPHVELAKREVVDAGNLTTNAKRLQAGLAPLKPRNLYNPSRVAARTPAPSSVPQVSGNIIVKRADGSVAGYVSTQDYGYLTTGDDKTVASFYPINPPFNIAVTGMEFPYLGFLSTTSLTVTTGSGISMISTNPTAPGSTPKNVGNPYSNLQTESSIWYYDPTDNQLSVQWTNSNGEIVFPSFAYSPSSGNRITLTMVPGANQVFLYLA